MKNSCWLLVVFVIISSAAFSQNAVLDFIASNLDEKVGNGLCLDFVIKSENEKYADWYNDYYMIEDSMVAHQIEIDSIKTGDVIILDNVVWNDSSITKSHIGFSGVKYGSNVALISQNSGSGKKKHIKYHGYDMEVYEDSKVVYEVIDLDKIISGHIYAFRF